ncbi:YhcN/YlaJ family sporulation lipoprotein [Bacillus sp. Marseille-P3661]|uniref:YhcN/YlaJ family sporulation lipoprotein n=1 Tax=Bacillus sp. Marseille-P3661 TaxID=1936234 RepID=UPI000C859131|nr:YhcN/YlaJ family sporulation lipoprotein [Bacillus sp. Marseille-P3661]
MNKFVASISAAMVLGGLVGCGVNDNAQDIMDNDSPVTQVGYANNDRDGAFTNINDRGFNDQEMFDQVDALNVGHRMGDSMEDGEAVSQRGTYGHNDTNFHGQYNTTINGMPTSSYNTLHDHVIAQHIADRIEHVRNVKDVATVIDGRTVLVAIDTNDNNDTNVEREVRRIAEGMSNGRKVRVVTDEGIVERVRSLNNGTNNNRNVDTDLSDMLIDK